MKEHIKKKILKQIPEWDCFGYIGYGQGRAVAEFGDSEVGSVSVCHNLCPRMKECREDHHDKMDKRFPDIAKIVQTSVVLAEKIKLPVVPTVMSALNVAINRQSVEALRIQEGLKKYKVETMTDHYVYGQFENLDHGIHKQSADTKPTLILLRADTGLLVDFASIKK